MESSADDEVEDVELYGQSLELLTSSKPFSMSSVLFTVLMLFFVAGLFIDVRSISGVILLTAVVIFHEAGHVLGMRAFGFKDVQMFFIPFFGAAVSGRDRHAVAWKGALVTLLGPLPGLFVGLAVLVAASTRPRPAPLPFEIAGALLWLNAFNLLPLGFLDGGRFLEDVIFTRNRVLAVAFRCTGILLLVYLAWIGRMYVLGLFAVMGLFAIPLYWRTMSASVALRKKLPAIGPDPLKLGETERRAAFSAARGVLQYPANERPQNVARSMAAILDGTRRPPGVFTTLGLLCLYGLGLALGAFGIILHSAHVGPIEWRAVEGPGWRAEFPRSPLTAPASNSSGARAVSWRAVVDGTERFTIETMGGPNEDGWMRTEAEKIARASQMNVAGARRIEISGHAGTEFELSVDGRILRARMVASDSTRYVVTASAPRWGENQVRFMSSFFLKDSLNSPGPTQVRR